MPAKKAAFGVLASAVPDLTPLAYMLQILRDPKATAEERRWAAEHAAPFCHAKMATIDHTGDVVLRHDDADDMLGGSNPNQRRRRRRQIAIAK